MRAAKRLWADPPPRSLHKNPRPQTGGGTAGSVRPGLLLTVFFLLGYLPGILAGRGGLPLGQALAAFYMDRQSFAAFGPVFVDMLAGAFLQCTLVLLGGFCALGWAVMAAVFALKGAYLGFCAASVFAAGGARALVVHWLLNCLPDLAVLMLLFSLALCAEPLSTALLRAAFGGGDRFGSTAALSRALLVRYLIVLAAGAGCCALGAWSAVFFAAALL